MLEENKVSLKKLGEDIPDDYDTDDCCLYGHCELYDTSKKWILKLKLRIITKHALGPEEQTIFLNISMKPILKKFRTFINISHRINENETFVFESDWFTNELSLQEQFYKNKFYLDICRMTSCFLFGPFCWCRMNMNEFQKYVTFESEMQLLAVICIIYTPKLSICLHKFWFQLQSNSCLFFGVESDIFNNIDFNRNLLTDKAEDHVKDIETGRFSQYFRT